MHKRAKDIVQKLKEHGYIAYYAGGWVRDFLLELDSDDIDIATSAPPDVVQSLFERTIPIGAAFGIILVIKGEHQYEVATFRRDLEYKDGRRPSAIEFTSAVEDAKRRDFTINGMFYDPIEKKIIDYVEGQKDLKKKIIKAIGNPHERIKEDRLRMLRAVRLSAKFDFEIEENTKKAIIAHAKELFPSVAIERIWQELSKMDVHKNFKKGLLILFDFGILQTIFPSLEKTDRKKIENRLLYLSSFPENSPVIAKILDLFPKSSLNEKIELCKYLKLSNDAVNFVSSYHHFSTLIAKKEIANDLWAFFYADKYSDICIKIIAAHMSFNEKATFLEYHAHKQNSLLPFIQRIENKDPVVKAKHLIACGISPSPMMGNLLKKAEKISINEKTEDTDAIIAELKKTNLWPKTL